MLDLKDFFHLPHVETLLDRVASEPQGLAVVAGLDPRPLAAATASGFLPSGRSTLFGILTRRMLAAHRTARAAIVADSKDAVRVPGSARGRVELDLVQPPQTYAEKVDEAVRRGSQIIVLDRLNSETATPALTAARAGRWVLSQLDCVFRGADAARHLSDLAGPDDTLQGLKWIITVQRVPTLCPRCRETIQPDLNSLNEFARRYSGLSLDGPFYRAGVCDHCRHTGRAGDVAAFDFFRAESAPPTLFEQPSLAPIQEYLWHLATRGYVAIDDVLHFDQEQLRRTYLLLAASERALSDANDELRRKLVELESSNRVLRQRTESLISLQEIAHTLITSTELDDLASRISRYTHRLCGADRSVLYLLRPDDTAEIVSASGWDPSILHVRLEASQVFGADPIRPDGADSQAAAFRGWPPGISPRPADVEGAQLHAGLRIPLIANHEVVGLLILHSTFKERFGAGEVALVQAFADQAALAIQRIGLVESLRDKIAQLEAAQAGLIVKERLERELELARQVQQSLLPRVFPEVPGYAFAARNEAARRVSGDFYDVFLLDADHFGIVIADVSDKGMPAALFMALTRSLLLAEARRELSPVKTLASVHRLLLELGEPDMFVTVFYGVIDTRAHTLNYVRAGHEEPYLLRTGEIWPLGGKGTFLGALDPDQLSLAEVQMRLAAGDCFVLYTDGLIDALGPDGQPFGPERLQALVRQRAGCTPEELCTAVFAELSAFQGSTEQFDDMAMLVVQTPAET